MTAKGLRCPDYGIKREWLALRRRDLINKRPFPKDNRSLRE